MQITFYILIGIFALYTLLANIHLCWTTFKLSKLHYSVIRMDALLNRGIHIRESLSDIKRKLYFAAAKSLFIRAVIVAVLVYLVMQMG